MKKFFIGLILATCFFGNLLWAPLDRTHNYVKPLIPQAVTPEKLEGFINAGVWYANKLGYNKIQEVLKEPLFKTNPTAYLTTTIENEETGASRDANISALAVLEFPQPVGNIIIIEIFKRKIKDNPFDLGWNYRFISGLQASKFGAELPNAFAPKVKVKFLKKLSAEFAASQEASTSSLTETVNQQIADLGLPHSSNASIFLLIVANGDKSMAAPHSQFLTLETTNIPGAEAIIDLPGTFAPLNEQNRPVARLVNQALVKLLTKTMPIINVARSTLTKIFDGIIGKRPIIIIKVDSPGILISGYGRSQRLPSFASLQGSLCSWRTYSDSLLKSLIEQTTGSNYNPDSPKNPRFANQAGQALLQVWDSTLFAPLAAGGGARGVRALRTAREQVLEETPPESGA